MPEELAPPPLGLLLRAIAGEPAAVEELTRMFLPRVYGLCLRISRQQEIAEDATQETFVRALRALPKLRQTDRFVSWILVIAANTTRELLKKQAREGKLGEELDQLELEPSATEDSRQAAVDHALSQLAPTERELFLLHSVEGVRLGELAEQCQQTVPALKSRLHRTRAKIRTLAFRFLSESAGSRDLDSIDPEEMNPNDRSAPA